MQLKLKSNPAVRVTLMAPFLICIFAIDTITNAEIAAAVFYIAVILVAVGLLPRHSVIILAATCVVLTFLSFLLTTTGSREAGAINLGISISVIGITTYLALKMVAAEAAVHEARAQLLRIARLSSLGELTTSIAHEVNQPLAAVVSSGSACLRWLNLEPPNLDKARRSVERIIGDANRASEVIARVRGLTRSETPKRHWIDINEAVTESIALAGSEIDQNGISLSLILTDDLPPVLADKIQLQQVIGNLVLNAIEAMNDIPTSRRVLEITSALDATGEAVVLSVGDSGTGLNPGAEDHIFEAFWTTKEGGTGIGLTISRSIVEAHGGRIWLGPNLVTGTMSHISLPAKGGSAR